MKFLGPPQSGSSQGDTSSRSRFGQYYRSRRAPVNPNSSAQSLSRGRLAGASQAWRGLSEAARAAWSAAAAQVGSQDSLGQTMSPTGAQLYIGTYTMMQQAGLTVPPALLTTSPPAAPVVTAVSGAISSDFPITLSVAPTGTVRVIVDLSPPVSAGVAFCADARFMYTATAFVGGALRPYPFWLVKFGTGVVGRRVFYRLRAVSAAGGVSAPAVGSFLITS